MMPGTELGHIRWRDPQAKSKDTDDGLNSEMLFVVASDANIANAQFCHFLHWTETGRTPRAQGLWTELAPVIKANISIWESNANGKTGDGAFFYNRWQRACGREDCDPSDWARKGDGEMEPIFLRAFDDQDRTSVSLTKVQIERLMNDLSSDEQKLVDNRGLTPGQIAWRRQQIEGTYGGRVDDFYMNCPDTPPQAFGARGQHYFDFFGLEFVRRSLRAPEREGELTVEEPDKPLIDETGRPTQRVHIIDEKGGGFRFYVLPDETQRLGHGERLLASADPCLGAKSDEHPDDAGTKVKGVHSKAAAQILDRLTTEEFEARIIVDYLKNATEKEFAWDLMLLGILYGFPKLGLARRVIGESTMDHLLEYGYPHNRIYRSVYKGAPNPRNRYQKIKLGFWEDKDTRVFAYGRLQEVIAEKRWGIFSDRILASLEGVTAETVWKKPHRKIDELLDDPADACMMLARMDDEYPPYIGESDEQVEKRIKAENFTVWDALRLYGDRNVRSRPRSVGFHPL